MTWWHPKPLRPKAVNPLFPVDERPVVVKGLDPWQRQRAADGTPPTTPGPTALRPPDPPLFIRDELTKGSLAAKLGERVRQPVTDPVDPLGVVKAYLAKEDTDKSEAISKSQKLTSSMNKAMAQLEKVAGLSKAKEHEDPEGGLTAAGRKHFAKEEGSKLKPGVKGKDAELSDEEKRRKGSFLTRHYKGEFNAKKPLKDEKGEPTRHALQAQAWGEPTPKNDADRRKLVADGERLLAQAEKAKEVKKSSDDLSKAELTYKKREKLKKQSFALPDERKYPIHDEAHARNALARVAQHGTPEEQKQVRRAVAKRYPGIEVTHPDKDEDKEDMEKALINKMTFAVNSLAKACGSSYMVKASDDAEDDEDSAEDETMDELERSMGDYTKPGLRERLKNEIMAGSKGGNPGQWSARKAQLLAQRYEEAGGGYKGSKSKKQRSLSKWTKEEWTTKDGKPAKRGDKMARYLPKKAWESMTPEQREATHQKKLKGKGQFVENTEAAKKAGRKARTAGGDK